jgi:hypothetical protein
MDKVEYPYEPNLRNKCVADDGREFSNLLTTLKWSKWPGKFPFKTSRFNRQQCRSIWQWLGRTDPVPKFLDCYVCGEDMDWLDGKRERLPPFNESAD